VVTMNSNELQQLIDLTKRDYRCAQCWSPLDYFLPAKKVQCAKYRSEHFGFTPLWFVKEARQKDEADALEVRDGLIKAGVLGGDKDDKQIKSELGY